MQIVIQPRGQVDSGRADAIAAPKNARVGTIAGRLVPAMAPAQALPAHGGYAIAALAARAGLTHITTCHSRISAG
jgi:hypothetical protein